MVLNITNVNFVLVMMGVVSGMIVHPTIIYKYGKVITIIILTYIIILLIS